jgi:hypothetical protein
VVDSKLVQYTSFDSFLLASQFWNCVGGRKQGFRG